MISSSRSPVGQPSLMVGISIFLEPKLLMKASASTKAEMWVFFLDIGLELFDALLQTYKVPFLVVYLRT